MEQNVKDNGAVGTSTTDNKATEPATKTYTQEEVEKLLQKETDKRVTEALKKQKSKFDEAQKLAAMSAEEKVDYEYKQKLAELEAREKAVSHKEMLMELGKQLSAKQLPQGAAEFLVAADAEQTNKNIAAFEKMFKEAIESEIKKRLGNTTPTVGTTDNKVLTKEQFRKMNVQQQAALYRDNPELYKALTE